MTEADRLNALLEREAPAVARCLSPLGRAAAFPKGITWMGEQARGCAVDATLGQTTDGSGRPIPVPVIQAGLVDTDPAISFLYGPVQGPLGVRQAWLERQRRHAGNPTSTVATPCATHGLTHSLSVVSSLFADPDTTVLVPDPAWDSYGLIFGMHAGARMRPWSTHRNGRFDIGGLSDALAQTPGKAILILNFPANPSGYTPSLAETAAIVERVAAHPGPLVVVTDDAYQGWIYAPGRMRRSIYWDLVERLDPTRAFAIKVDGATKELVFFASRVGFVTPGLGGEAAEALESKIKMVLRGTVGSPSGPALALIARALADAEGTDRAFAQRVAILGERWAALKEGLGRLEDRADVWEFNSAFFALLHLRGADAEATRARLLRDQGVGTIAFAGHGALRIAFCAIHRDAIGDLCDRLARGLT